MARKNNQQTEAVLVRFVCEQGIIQQRAIAVQSVEKTVDALELKGLLARQLARRNIELSRVVCVIADSASINGACVTLFNNEAKLLYEEERMTNSLHFVRCLAHMVNNSAKQLRAKLVDAELILKGIKGLNKSDAAKSIYKECTGEKMPFKSENRWVGWQLMGSGLLRDFAKLKRFASACRQRELMPAKVKRLDALLAEDASTSLKVGLELVAMKVFGQPLSDAIHALEGDGLLAPFAYSLLLSVNGFMREIESPRDASKDPRFLALQSFGTEHGHALPAVKVAELVGAAWSTRLAMVKHWKERIWDALKSEIDMFQGFSVLDPRVASTLAEPELMARLRALVAQERLVAPAKGAKGAPNRHVSGVKGVTQQMIVSLTAELVTYKRLVGEFTNVLAATEAPQRPGALWKWWWSIRAEVPCFFFVAHRAALCQPSSAAIERFYSVLKGATTKRQYAELGDTLEVRGLCMYNDRKASE